MSKRKNLSETILLSLPSHKRAEHKDLSSGVLVSLATPMRTVRRRRFLHHLRNVAPLILLFIAFMVLIFWMHVPANPCEPYNNC